MGSLDGQAVLVWTGKLQCNAQQINSKSLFLKPLSVLHPPLSPHPNTIITRDAVLCTLHAFLRCLS
jgi:hypothetical protein